MPLSLSSWYDSTSNGNISLTLSSASFHNSIFMAANTLPVLSKSAETIDDQMYNCARGLCFLACGINIESFSIYVLRSKPRLPRDWAISVTFLTKASGVYSSGSLTLGSPCGSLTLSLSFTLLSLTLSFRFLSLCLSLSASASLSSLSLFPCPGMMSHLNIFFSRLASSSSSLSESELPDEYVLSLSESESEPLSELESLSESLSEELPEELEELPDEADAEDALLAELSGSLASSSSSASSDSYFEGSSFNSWICSWNSRLPFLTFARNVFKAFCLFIDNFSPLVSLASLD
mmetsp:Transcript_60086/g.183536  ORF Transcript_60086/g.183536 Transcript_60086/m.183536 type:complete len:292 (+) Transcript_60086:1809-2684(+)